MASELFDIDEIDRNIIQLIQKEPTLTHTEIAKQVNRSQPTIGMRIRKLEELGILTIRDEPQLGMGLEISEPVIQFLLKTLDAIDAIRIELFGERG